VQALPYVSPVYDHSMHSLVKVTLRTELSWPPIREIKPKQVTQLRDFSAYRTRGSCWWDIPSIFVCKHHKKAKTYLHTQYSRDLVSVSYLSVLRFD
jgi:hypothetical protein